MLGRRKSLVYSSKDRADWEKADPRTFLSGKKSVPKTVYKIEVAAADEPAAKKELAGKVRPVLSYGYSI